MMIPPVGKSGPLTTLSRSSSLVSGFWRMRRQASTSSLRLWGGMFVAMPTAMPADPFRSRFGTPEGSTTGSDSLWSKFGANSTVSLSMSRSISSPMRDIRASVYL